MLKDKREYKQLDKLAENWEITNRDRIILDLWVIRWEVKSLENIIDMY